MNYKDACLLKKGKLRLFVGTSPWSALVHDDNVTPADTNKTQAEQRNSKALLDEQAKNKQLQDQITAMKQQFVHDLERINTQRAFQKHEQEAAQRRAKLQWQHSKQRSPVKPSTSGRAGGFQSSFVDAQPGPTRHSPRSSPTKGAKGVASPPSSKPQSPLANRAQDAFSELQNEDVTMNVDPVAVPSDSTDQDPVDLSIIRAKVRTPGCFFVVRLTS